MPPPCEHAEGQHQPESNRICFLWLHDAAYNRLWGGNGNVTPGTWNPLPTPAIVIGQPVDPGLGDLVEKALSAVGITQERVQRWIGRECGCTERKKKLNRLGTWAARLFRGESSKTEVDEILGKEGDT